MYLEGVGNTLKVAVLALILGVVLGLLVAMVRTFHDQRFSRSLTWINTSLPLTASQPPLQPAHEPAEDHHHGQIHMTLAPMKLLKKSREEAEEKALTLLDRVGLRDSLLLSLLSSLPMSQLRTITMARYTSATPNRAIKPP